jgi:hypothetical protein
MYFITFYQFNYLIYNELITPKFLIIIKPKEISRLLKSSKKCLVVLELKCMQDTFTCIRGYITTLKKNKENVLENIKNVFLKKPFMPVWAE